MRKFREHPAPAQLILCAGDTSKRTALAPSMSPSMIVPPLTRRRGDINRIVSAHALDAIGQLGAELTSFSDAERQRVVAHKAKTWADIEIATLRIVARRHAGSVHGAAERLGISNTGLDKWFKRRRR
jgi:transcriptional regulator with PAS, ATPase and Fis domain